MARYESPRERNALSISSTCDPTVHLTYLCKCQEESRGYIKERLFRASDGNNISR